MMAALGDCDFQFECLAAEHYSARRRCAVIGTAFEISIEGRRQPAIAEEDGGLVVIVVDFRVAAG
jgi:hypothetical protein